MTVTTGFRSHRLDRGLTVQQLSSHSGISPYIIRHCEEGDFGQVSLYRMLALADTLGISLSEGCRAGQISGARRRPRQQEPRNILECYLLHRALTLRELSEILGVSVQTVSVQCGKNSPSMKYIRRLAEEDGLSIQAFITCYSTARCA